MSAAEQRRVHKERLFSGLEEKLASEIKGRMQERREAADTQVNT